MVDFISVLKDCLNISDYDNDVKNAVEFVLDKLCILPNKSKNVIIPYLFLFGKYVTAKNGILSGVKNTDIKIYKNV